MRTYATKTARPSGFQLWVGPTAAPQQMHMTMEDASMAVVIRALAEERERLAGTATTLAIMNRREGAFVKVVACR